jgi:hypothetical protein
MPIFQSEYFKVKKNGISPFQTMVAYLGGSAFQTVIDNPVTAYRQLVQQYAKDLKGNTVDPKISRHEAITVFKKSPVSASMSGLGPRLIGVGLKRIPKFGFLLGYSYIYEEETPSYLAATTAAILSAPFINPIRMIEKQQRAYFKQTGTEKSVASILRESKDKRFKPLFRGTIPLMGHSFVSAVLGLVGQPQLQQHIQKKIGNNTQLSMSSTNLLASALVSPIYVIATNPLSRLEVIMQTSSIKGKSISAINAIKEVVIDSKNYGIRGIFRGQGIGMCKAIISLTMFHEGRIFLTDYFKNRNIKLGHTKKMTIKQP